MPLNLSSSSWLLLCLRTTALVHAVQVQCNLLVCKLADLEPEREPSFVFSYIPSTTLLLSFANLLAPDVQPSFLDHASTLVREVAIVNSPDVSRIGISRHLNLSTLYVGKTSLSTLTVEGANGALRDVTIGYSLLSAIPPDLGHLRGLRVLAIRDASIETADLGIFCTTLELHTLRLLRNKIRFVANRSRRPSCRPAMEELDLKANALAVLNLELFGACTRLASLDVSHNCIELVTGSADSRALAKLYLRGNRIKQLDCCQWHLPALGELHVVQNALSAMPRCIGRLANLSLLALGCNRLAHFDVRPLGGLRRLRSVDLSSNRLTAALLNDRVAFPPRLVELDLTDNLLTSLNLSHAPAHPSLQVRARNNSICSLDLSHTLLRAKNVFLDEGKCGRANGTRKRKP